jgi:hypothetical protein
MAVKFNVKRVGGVADAVITSEGKEVATMSRRADRRFELSIMEDGSWTLDPRVNGEVRPFSLEATSHDLPSVPVLTIMNHVFQYRRNFYLMMGIPEDVHPRDHLLGGRHIIRLDKFPFSTLGEVDRETWGRLKRLRGVSVGQIAGLGLDGHSVELTDELKEIALPLAAASYLLYSTG